MPVIDDCVRRASGKVGDPDLLSGVLDLRLRHFAKADDPAGCRATAEMWEKLGRTDPDSLYLAATMRAVTAGIARQAGGDAAERAVAWLRQSAKATPLDAKKLKTEPDFETLKDRPDFRAILADLGKSDPSNR